MSREKDTLWKYAPVWATLFATGATILKTVGTRYILKREAQFEWSDAATALAGAVLGYAMFRVRHGNKEESLWTR